MGRDVAQCVNSEAGGHRALALARIVRRLSSSLVEPVDVDYSIVEALEAINRLYGGTRARLFRVRTHAEAPVMTHEWGVVAIIPPTDCPAERQAGASPWVVNQLQTGNALFFPDLSALPKEAATDLSGLQAEGIRSLLAVPVRMAGVLEAFIQVDNIRQTNPWPLEEQPLLEAAGNVIGAALNRTAPGIGRLEDDQVCHEYFELRSVGIAATNPQGQLVQVSDELCDLLGYDRSELLSLTLQDHFYPDDLAEHQAEYDRLIRGEVQSYPSYKRLLRKDGRPLLASLTVTCRREAAGKISNVFVFAKDFTKHHETAQALRMEKEKVETYLQIAGALIVALDMQGNVSLINRKGCELLGYDADQIIGKSWFDHFVPSSVRRETRATFRQLMRGETKPSQVYENLISCRDGRERLIAWHNAVMRDSQGRAVGALSSGDDITERKATEVALRRREEVLRRLLETTGEGIYGLDLEGRVTICNPACAGFLGYADANELLGQHMHSLIRHSRSDGQFYPDTDCPIHAAMRDGKAIHAEGDLFYRKDGTRFPVAYRSVPMREGEGLVGAVVSFSDITERLQAEEARQERISTLRRHQRALLEIVGSSLTSGDSLAQQLGALTEIAGRTLRVERTSIWEQDLAATSIRCLDLYELTHERHTSGTELMRSHYPAYFHALRSKGIIDAEHARSDPRTREYADSSLEPLGITSMLDAAIIAGGRRTGVLCFEHVGTPRRWSMEEIGFAHSVAALAALGFTLDELRTTVTALQESEGQVREHTAHLEVANQELKAFAYIVSHDMRAPLINIGGYAGELRTLLDEMKDAIATSADRLESEARTKIDRLFEQDVPEALDFIQGSVQRLERQIDAILRLSRLGRMELQPQELDLKTLVTDALESLAHRVEEVGATVTVGEFPLVVCDRIAMELVIGNLLDNAVKYLDPHRPGRIEVNAERAQDHVLVYVRDNGQGIAEEDLDRIFHVFRRVGDQRVPGEGMGLAYAKAVVQRLGGNIRCQSVLGQGCTFSFDLPDSCCQTPKCAREHHDIGG